ncbi:hypothetical protein QNI19_07875 [Cytophagaceae bacterium DM2B3-1]|uniref:Glycosyltransferase RgtA/B/C/D-like domain-containing protein n=1 Tax=Xanthocytophaga flava TaxID=3048013 RepID=A0ABT7CIG3_9BACT|nr:hypothetical protein [Xanthocytophaga flavus]MDJ1492847.1 hypothetical protein [Xanthocytophaga flavus]
MLFTIIKPLIPFLIHLPLVAYLLIQWSKQLVDLPLKQWFWPAVGIKLLAGCVVGLLYLYYYPYQGDTWLLFDESTLLNKLAFRSPVDYLRVLLLNNTAHAQHYVILDLAEQPRAFFMAKILSLINLFTFHNYWITGAYCSLLSFYGLWKLANQLVRYFPDTRLSACIAFLFFPTVVFWSSGVLKESIAVACICRIIGIVLQRLHTTDTGIPKWEDLLKKLRIQDVFWFGISFYVLWQMKFYYAGVLVVALMALCSTLCICFVLRTTGFRIMKAIYFLCFTGIFNLVPLGYTFLTGQSLLESIVQNHDATVRASSPGTFIIFSGLQPVSTSFLQHFPLALWSGLFSPMSWQAHTSLVLSVSLENSVLLLGCIGYFLTFFRTWKNENNETESVLYQLIVQSIWWYSLTLAVILAFASPNFGALIRYKVGFLPLLVYVVFSKIEKIKRQNKRSTHANT